MKAVAALMVFFAFFVILGFVGGWKYEQSRIYKPVEVPLDCGGGGGSPGRPPTAT